MGMMEKGAWNDFVASASGGSFLQSWEWGQMQERLGVPYWRLAEEDVAAALVMKRELPWGKSWLYVPRGPVFAQVSTGKAFLQQVVDVARREGAVFVRIEPPTIPSEPWQKAVNDVQPRHTIMVDLTQSGEDLLGAMHQKTRYNIRLAQRKGVTIRFSRDRQDLDHFLRLSKDVSGRAAFSYHPDSYYEAMLQLPSVELAIAEHEEDVLAVHILISFGDTVTYVHGSSSSEKRSLMAPHMLQWESIKRAKGAGFTKYDFFGVAPLKADSLHPWAGITKFKEGFGGQRVSYVGAYDYVLDAVWYWTYSTSRRARSLWR